MNAGELTLPIRDAAGHVGNGQPSFEELMALHQQRVVRTAYRLLGRMEDAQDASQEVFLRLLKNLDKVDGDPQAWLYRVTVNVCNDQFRRKLAVVEAPERADPSPRVDRILEMGERKALLMAGLETLAERERAAVVLRDIEGLPTREVAAILGVEEVTVRSQICGARMKLAKYVRNPR
jgi:RNA polymerase sigma-70 factor (ECF subfamily)